MWNSNFNLMNMLSMFTMPMMNPFMGSYSSYTGSIFNSGYSSCYSGCNGYNSYSNSIFGCLLGFGAVALAVDTYNNYKENNPSKETQLEELLADKKAILEEVGESEDTVLKFNEDSYTCAEKTALQTATSEASNAGTAYTKAQTATSKAEEAMKEAALSDDEKKLISLYENHYNETEKQQNRDAYLNAVAKQATYKAKVEAYEKAQKAEAEAKEKKEAAEARQKEAQEAYDAKEKAMGDAKATIKHINNQIDDLKLDIADGTKLGVLKHGRTFKKPFNKLMESTDSDKYKNVTVRNMNAAIHAYRFEGNPDKKETYRQAFIDMYNEYKGDKSQALTDAYNILRQKTTEG